MQNTGSAEFGRFPVAILESYYDTQRSFASTLPARG
jgi:hypothetical protein